MGSPLVIDIGSLLQAGRPISLDDFVTVPPFGQHRFLSRRVSRSNSGVLTKGCKSTA